MVRPALTPTRFILPLWLLLLDFIGLALVGLGIAQHMGRVHIVPQDWQLPYAGWLLMVLGVLCMLPLVLAMIRVVRQVRQEENAWLKTLPEDIQKKLADKFKNTPKH